MVTVMKGREVARAIQDTTKAEVERLTELGHQPRLVIIRVGDDKGSIGYQHAAEKLMGKLGIEVEVAEFDADISMPAFENEFLAINDSENVDAILMLRPLPAQLNENRIQQLIDPSKDIDGMSPINLGKSLDPNTTDFVPITPAAVMQMMAYYDISLVGKRVTVVGNSLVVGRPLADMLMAREATVSVCNIDTPDNAEFTRNADIVIAAVGKVGLITGSMVKNGAIVIDVGTNYDETGHLTGDVMYDEVAAKVAFINPVTNGVGSITTSLLAKRVVQAARANVVVTGMVER
ncbi:bifunctional 5,10-methylenetetrahydrofolate dehydrogenase/5,10-methenyltetrahydrofolate cyclohydrolase [Lentilactobacillus sp. Marseille-Q4993]|uniref:bifunctional 5,10-methylenetetrahydrofolate dehydrogenase/5,10-methenyltetrahydrofolate cyclohydrolase n=1 Tax=Lentilactobacillus sp. Marseille-Q4993 TaxID=3039492 RepID=UPI0024BC9967|nr:bifunctional 5,10-methylenetetrahydrofolate dehydrogenase/5,10-methenyltetrahydrofolate cyclohydrolase [Lentilactobacillus sp. Marseille-Q4993]